MVGFKMPVKLLGVKSVFRCISLYARIDERFFIIHYHILPTFPRKMMARVLITM